LNLGGIGYQKGPVLIPHVASRLIFSAPVAIIGLYEHLQGDQTVDESGSTTVVLVEK
jgi:hypothetical protein